MEYKKNFPTSWVKVKLEIISSKITKGATPTTYGFSFVRNGINFIKVENIKNNILDVKSINDFISPEAHSYQKKSILEDNDILFSIAGTIGNTCIVKKEHLPANTNQALAIIQGYSDFIIPNLLKIQLDSFVTLATKAKARGGAMNNISLGDLKNLEVILPPLPEQHRIVDKIEELFSELDNGVENLKKAQAQLKTYRQAVLKYAFEGKLTEDWRKKEPPEPAEELLEQIKAEREKHYQQQIERWKQAVKKWEANGGKGKKPTRISKPKILSELTSEVTDRYDEIPTSWLWSTFCNVTYKIGDIDHKMPKVFPGGLPYLSTGNLKNDGTIDFTKAKTISKEDFHSLSLKIKPEKGDIIFPRYGTIGRNILINFNKEFLVSYSCAIVKNIGLLMDVKFVYYYSLSPLIKKEVERYTVQTTQANIGIASIESFVFPLCSRKEQQAIVQEIESRLSVCDKIEQSIEKSLKQAEALRQSILKKAFEGKLVPQNPDDEPAEKLLERIKTEKEKLEAEIQSKKKAVKKRKKAVA